jgi:two-component system alkaline phosphatase synthesis response regulator PhoP
VSSQYRVLIIDDEPDIVDLIKSYLVKDGYTVESGYTSHDALKLAKSFKPNLIILDLMIPGIDGFAVTRRLREFTDVPIIMVTARDTETDKLRGLELGADDYVTKPFSPRELVARVKAVLRRSTGNRDDEIIRLGDLIIDPNRFYISRGGEEVSLTATEFKILHTMAQNPGKVFTRLQLIDNLHGYTFDGYDRTIDAHIKNIRQKLEPDPPRPVYLLTVFGVGYKLEAPEDVS